MEDTGEGLAVLELSDAHATTRSKPIKRIVGQQVRLCLLHKIVI